MLPSIKRTLPRSMKRIVAVSALQALLLWGGTLWLFGVDLTNPILLVCGGLLFGFMLRLFLVELRTHTNRLGLGCLLFLGLTLTSGLLALAGFAGRLMGMPWETLSDWAFFLFSLVLLAGVPCAAFGGIEGYYYQDYLARRLYRDLGFVHSTNRMPGAGKRVFISHLQPGGLLAEAGFQVGDVVLDMPGSSSFFKQLERARGGDAITIRVARSADPVPYRDSTPLPKRPQAALTVLVPARDSSTRLEKELGFHCALDFLKEAGEWLAVLVVTDIRRGGVMEQAGFQDRDILIDVKNAPGFYDKLEAARGKEPMAVGVVSWMDPPDVRDRPERELTLQMPPKGSGGPPTPHLPGYRLEAELERDLGFRFGWEWLPVNGEWQGTRTIERLAPDGILARAGIREKDIVLPESILIARRFPRSWERARGGEPIAVRVASWVEPPPLHERPHRVLTVRVPPRES